MGVPLRGMAPGRGRPIHSPPMASSQDQAFFRHAVDAGFMSEAVSQLCARALDGALAEGRAVTANQLAVELGMIDPAAAQRTLDALRVTANLEVMKANLEAINEK